MARPPRAAAPGRSLALEPRRAIVLPLAVLAALVLLPLWLAGTFSNGKTATPSMSGPASSGAYDPGCL